ncbi:hypothetical protein [Candidatus Laterigemmans baculatus]|uniref:hypothetical protein n=1 Tax=Candidatus Laterigemmans baculatus TaxID=2770505 RepID=UPI0013DC1F3D|nr:hypothetical protein [Candidatus Laterigemmans baculatus]
MSRSKLDVLKLPWLGLAVATVLSLSFAAQASAQDWFDDPYYNYGAYYDDGNYTDDWYFDYYDDYYNYNYYEDYDEYGDRDFYRDGYEGYFDYEYGPADRLYEDGGYGPEGWMGRGAGVELDY